jgi:hypothetical protein
VLKIVGHFALRKIFFKTKRHYSSLFIKPSAKTKC